MLLKYLFTEPLIWTVLVGLIAAMLSRYSRKYALCLLVFFAGFLLFLSLPFTSSRLLRAVEVTTTPSTAERKMSPQAIVVLSAGLNNNALEYGGTSIGNLSLIRARYGAHLHRENGLPILISGGKWRESERSLADHIAQVLQTEFNVSVKWLEETSQNTFENARESSKILRAEGIGTVYLVTHAFHMRRAAEAFEKNGLKVVPAPTNFVDVDATPDFHHFLPSSFALAKSQYMIGEIIGRLWYHIFYY